jgi:ribonuclease P protein component
MGSLEMLRSVADFQALQAQSRSRAQPVLLVRYRRNDVGRTRFGISTGKRVGSAVVRNQIRRRLRTILRRLDGQMEEGWDILLVARPPAALATQQELEQAVRRLFGSAGLIKATGENRTVEKTGER